MGSKVAGDPAGKYTVRDPATGRFVPVPATGPSEEADQQASDPAKPKPGPAAVPAGGPSVIRRLLTGSLRDLVRGR